MSLELSKGNLMLLEVILKAIKIDPSVVIAKAAELETAAKTAGGFVVSKVGSIDERLKVIEERTERIEYMLSVALAKMVSIDEGISPAGESSLSLLECSHGG